MCSTHAHTRTHTHTHTLANYTHLSSLPLKPTDAVVTFSVCRSSEPKTLREAAAAADAFLLPAPLLRLGSVLQRGRKSSLSCVWRGGRLRSGCGDASESCCCCCCSCCGGGVSELARSRRRGEAERLVRRHVLMTLTLLPLPLLLPLLLLRPCDCSSR